MKRQTKQVKLQVRLSEEMSAQVEEEVRRSGETASYVIREALRKFFQFHDVRPTVRPKSGAV